MNVVVKLPGANNDKFEQRNKDAESCSTQAGRGSRFAEAGYKMPKPLIDVFGHPMIEYVTYN